MLRVIPIELKVAQDTVRAWHRHHAPPIAHRFSLACVGEDGRLHGVAVIGRPVARMCNPRTVLEVARVATDGTRNACSILLGAAARAGRAMGYERIQTYTLPEEGGASLRGAGWVPIAMTPGGQWQHTDGKDRRTDQPTGPKIRWEKHLNNPVPPFEVPVPEDSTPQLSMFNTTTLRG